MQKRCSGCQQWNANSARRCGSYGVGVRRGSSSHQNAFRGRGGRTIAVETYCPAAPEKKYVAGHSASPLPTMMDMSNGTKAGFRIVVSRQGWSGAQHPVGCAPGSRRGRSDDRVLQNYGARIERSLNAVFTECSCRFWASRLNAKLKFRL